MTYLPRSISQKGLKALLLMSLGIVLSSCHSDNDTPVPAAATVIDTAVTAARGGTFVDESNSITITVPAGALSVDATLKVTPVAAPPAVSDNQTAASSAFQIEFIPASGNAALSFNQPMRMEIKTDTPPEHPQIGEITAFDNGKWVRMPANFFRTSDSTTVALSKRTSNTFQVVHRTLQSRTDTDPAVVRGRELYFNDDWGSHTYWTGTFQLNELLNADVVTPAFAASLGMQIDVNKVPQPIVAALTGNDFDLKQAALNDHNTTIALLQAGAVLGLNAQFNDPAQPNRITDVGLTCALCHVTVDPISFQIAPPPAELTPLPIGQPIIGPPNANIALGTILANTPPVAGGTLANRDGSLADTAPYATWPRGMFDPRFMPDNPIDDGVNNPSQIPQHWNYIDLAEQDYDITWIGILHTTSDNESLASGPECGIDLPLGTNGAWGTDSAIISNFEFGNTLPQWVFDALRDSEDSQPGIGTEPGVTQEVTKDKLLDLKAFMESIVSPAPGEYDETLALAGWELFNGKANCTACHGSAEFTRGKSARGDITQNAGIYFTNIVENEPQGLLGLGIKVPQLRGISSTAPFFHDGSAATLLDVMERYSSGVDSVPTLSANEQAALVEYMKSL